MTETVHRGVYWVKNRKKWHAQITRNRKRIFVGEFDNLLDAVEARKNKNDSLPPKIMKDFIGAGRIRNSRSFKKDSCEKCGAGGNLFLHHIIPINWGGEFIEDNCITLCSLCHLDAHRLLRKSLTLQVRHKFLSTHLSEIKELLCI
jgi:5-methylcytosine-specific restriction endonuclease McrA